MPRVPERPGASARVLQGSHRASHTSPCFWTGSVHGELDGEVMIQRNWWATE